MAKKKKQDAKTKNYTVKVDISPFEGLFESSLVIGKNFDITLRDSVGNTVLPTSKSFEVTYSRENKNSKTVNAIFVDGHEGGAAFGNDYLKNYDEIYVIDTNSSKRVIEGNRLSVSAVIGGYVIDREVEAIERIFTAYPLTWIQIWNPVDSVNVERIGWMEAIRAIVRDQDRFKGIQDVLPKKVAVIVDSDYGALNALNSRAEAILGDYFLPENFTLLFATDSAGKQQFIANYLMQRAHTMSKELIEYVNELPQKFEKLKASHDFCSHVGFVDAKNRYEFT